MHAPKCKRTIYIQNKKPGKKMHLPKCDCDGSHSFGELYDHRITLFITLCRMYDEFVDPSVWFIKEGRVFNVWRSKFHDDGSFYDGWFLLGIRKEKGEQITYHIPMRRWGETDFAETLGKAPPFDGHTSDDVLARLKDLCLM